MKTSKRLLAFLFALLVISLDCLCVYAEEILPEEPTIPPEEPVVFVLEITSPSDTLRIEETLTLSVNTDEAVNWTSSDTAVATVSSNGTVTGVGVGKVTITATTVPVGDEAPLTSEITLFVTNKQRFWRDYLSEHQVLSYMYEYKGDYYYCNDKDCWQKNFGFNFVYDTIAPLYWLEYDYVRVFFTYEGLDWMIQMWKGQYGLVFYGSEIGVYTKKEGADFATRISHYACADESNYLKMESSLYRKDRSGNSYAHEFTREYDDYWWCTGFVPGRLRDTTPCDELRTVSRLTLKSEEMTTLFANGLAECGFKEVDSKENISDDTFYVDGCDVFLQWQNISEAANSRVIQFSFWSIVGLNGLMLALLMGVSLLALTTFGALLIFFI